MTPFWLICTVCTVRLDTFQNIEAVQQIRAQERLHKTVVQATKSRRQITFPSLKKVPCTFVVVNHVTKLASLCAILECESPHIVVYLVSSIGAWTKTLRESVERLYSQICNDEHLGFWRSVQLIFMG